MKRIILSAAVLLSLTIFGTTTTASATETQPQQSSTSSVIQYEELPDDIQQYLLDSGYDIATTEVSYTSDPGETVYNLTRAYQVSVQSAMYVEKNSYGSVISTSNIRYKTLNVNNGYERTGYYEVYVRKQGSNYIYDRIFTYRTW